MKEGMEIRKCIGTCIENVFKLFVHFMVLIPILLCTLVVCFLVSFIAPWFAATKVTRINACCRFELNITGYLFQDYTFSSATIKHSCDNTSCDNFTIDDDFLSKMESDIKQDTSSAESTLDFVRASPVLLLCNWIVSCIILFCLFESKRAMVLIVILMTAMTILASAGAAVYPTVYKNQIGFNYGDLDSGWTCIVIMSSLVLILDIISIFFKVDFYIKDRRKQKNSKICIATISQPNFLQDYQSPTQLPQNKITADDWLFVKLDDRDAIVDIHESVVYNHACTDNMDDAVTDLPKTIKLKINTLESTKKGIVIFFQKLVDTIWDQDLVGKGADAKNLSHKTLNVISVDPGYIDYNTNVRKYMANRSVILKRIKRFGKLPCLNAAHCSPIQTTEFIENVPKVYLRLMGMENLNTRLNEYYLFHGTSECNVDNILKYGFDICKVKRPFLGKGIYFTESPVKADQYTGYGSSSTGCVLLCRVILGNFIIRKTKPSSGLKNWTHLPCSRCLDENCIQHSPDERFDSLIYDQPHGLFREFVIFNTDQILVESVIKYIRVTDSENLNL